MKLSTVPLLSFLAAAFAQAGSYGPQPFAYPNNTKDLGDGTAINSNTGVASVQSGYLRLTRHTTGNTSSSFKLPDLDSGEEAESFTATFRLRVFASGQPADGFTFNFGDIPAGDGGGENGFAMDGGFYLAFDTYPNGGEQPSIEAFANGVSVGNAPRDWSATNGDWVDVAIHWDTSGLDVTFAGAAVFTNLPTPGFVPAAGNAVAFSGRTGGATQDTFIDNLEIQTTTAVPVQTGGPVISEFVAANSQGLEDDYVDRPDWIEIYNGQNSSVNLAGYTLTTDPANPAPWTFPALTLPPYGYLTVYASGRNRTTGLLHTDFTLPKAGGYLALKNPGGTVVSEFSYPTQAEDVSYGELGQERTLGFLATPSPGAKNSGLQAAGPPAETPVFSTPGGLFSTAFSLSVADPVAPGAVVRYTLDNTVPSEASPVYSTPFTISQTTTVRARVFEPGRLPGKTRSRTFLHLASDVRNFSSDLPIIVADSHGVTLTAANRSFRPVYTVTIDTSADDGRAAMDDAPDFTGRGGMHVRGQSSSGFPKKQYAWETWDNRDNDDPASVLGFPSESDWIIHAPYSDKTLMRNKIVYDAARELHGNQGGVRSRFVELFFNQGGGSITDDDYMGVYLFTEKIKRDGDRIDVERLNEHVTDPELITGGYIFKKDKPPHSQPWNTSRGIPLDTHDPEFLNDAQASYLRGYMDDFERALYGSQFADPERGYAAYIDVPSFIDNHLFVETFKEIDGYRISSYFSKPRGGKVKSLPVWDYNLSLGNANYLTGDNPEGWYYTEIGGTNYPWYTRLFQDSEFVLAYWDRYWELRRSLFATANMMARIDGYDDELDEAQFSNFKKWDVLGKYLWPNPDGYQNRTTHQLEVDWMKDWFTDRLAWIDTQSRGIGGAAQPPAFNRYGGNVPDGFTLTMSQTNGWGGAQIYYTTDGSDPRESIGGGSETTFVAETATAEWLVPSEANGGADLNVAQWTGSAAPPNAGNWSSGPQGIGYERTPGGTFDFTGDIGSDVEAALYDQNGSVYIRLPFSAGSQASLAGLTGLTLRVKYDDSFVAYLNGQEVARDAARTPDPLQWNSGATGSHSDSLALSYVDFDLTPHIDKLQPGANTLALHGLNYFNNSSDALWRCELLATSGPSVSVYIGPLTLSAAAEVRARVHDGSRWSPLTGATFVVGAVPAVAGNTVVSELDYRPAPPSPAESAAGFTSRGDFEFIELMNIDPVSQTDTTGLVFSDGITFVFDEGLAPSSLQIPPLGRIVLASNPAAFSMRYPGVPVAGAFTGSLSNDGERMELLDAAGNQVKAFTYNDVEPWPTAADGDGFSLVLVSPESNPDHDLASSWRASGAVGGSPGGSDAVQFSGDPDVDADGDGITAFLEFVQGSSDSDPGDRPVPQAAIESLTVGAETAAYVVVSFQVAVGADAVTWSIRSSADLAAWRDSSAEWVPLEPVHHGDGTATLRYRSAAPFDPSSPASFHRLLFSSP